MKIATVTLKSESPYSQSKNIDKLVHPEKSKEGKDAYEGRTWRFRMHVNDDGHVFIPNTCFENSIREAAKRLAIPVPGKGGKVLFSKYFEAGIMVPDGITLGVKADDVKGERLFVPADGKPGSGKRVYRTFPRITSWDGTIKIYVFDDIITEDVLRKVVDSAGFLVGIGRFRPEKRGYYGRFSVTGWSWLDETDSALSTAAE